MFSKLTINKFFFYRNRDNQTPLQFCCLYDNEEIFLLLIKFGAEINTSEIHGVRFYQFCCLTFIECCVTLNRLFEALLLQSIL